jgi:cell division protein ZapA
MSQVSLRICGRDYAVSCADGEEAHVHALGNLIEEKLDSLPSSTAQNEVRTMLFAALLLADEVSELRRHVDTPATQPAVNQPATDPALAGRLDAVANAITRIAATLETLDD